MTGITLKGPLRTEIIVYFHCGLLQKLFADKRQNIRKVTLNPMILDEQLKKSIEEKQLKKSNQKM